MLPSLCKLTLHEVESTAANVESIAAYKKLAVEHLFLGECNKNRFNEIKVENLTVDDVLSMFTIVMVQNPYASATPGPDTPIKKKKKTPKGGMGAAIKTSTLNADELLSVHREIAAELLEELKIEVARQSNQKAECRKNFYLLANLIAMKQDYNDDVRNQRWWMATHTDPARRAQKSAEKAGIRRELNKQCAHVPLPEAVPPDCVTPQSAVVEMDEDEEPNELPVLTLEAQEALQKWQSDHAEEHARS